MPQRDWQGRSIDDPEWDGTDLPYGCAVIGLVGCSTLIAFVVGIIVGRWWG